MNAPRIIPGDVLAHQIKASDPGVSAWVAANAGSGKTHVLAQRVIRLLLEAGELLAAGVGLTAARWQVLDTPSRRALLSRSD